MAYYSDLSPPGVAIFEDDLFHSCFNEESCWRMTQGKIGPVTDLEDLLDLEWDKEKRREVSIYLFLLLSVSSKSRIEIKRVLESWLLNSIPDFCIISLIFRNFGANSSLLNFQPAIDKLKMVHNSVQEDKTRTMEMSKPYFADVLEFLVYFVPFMNSADLKALFIFISQILVDTFCLDFKVPLTHLLDRCCKFLPVEFLEDTLFVLYSIITSMDTNASSIRHMLYFINVLPVQNVKFKHTLLVPLSYLFMEFICTKVRYLSCDRNVLQPLNSSPFIAILKLFHEHMTKTKEAMEFACLAQLLEHILTCHPICANNVDDIRSITELMISVFYDLFPVNTPKFSLHGTTGIVSNMLTALKNKVYTVIRENRDNPYEI
uniref:Uncharacterized protein n=1 Tax=Cacopsylla melanoneura TaxID=428564 RepID=A0A8D8VJ10_9HEMI